LPAYVTLIWLLPHEYATRRMRSEIHRQATIAAHSIVLAKLKRERTQLSRMKKLSVAEISLSFDRRHFMPVAR
jgi:hypothetical protein